MHKIDPKSILRTKTQKLCVSASLRLYVLKNLHHQQPYSYRDYRRYHSWHHEGVVENIFTDFRCSCSVEVDCSYYCRVVRDEEISVDSWEQSDQKHWVQSEGNTKRHDSAHCGSLTIKEALQAFPWI